MSVFSATRIEQNDSSQQPQMTRLGLDLLISVVNDSSQPSYNLFRINSSKNIVVKYVEKNP